MTWLEQINQIWQQSFLPQKQDIIQPFTNMEPKKVRLVILSDRPKTNSPFAFYDSQQEFFYETKTNQMTAYLGKMILIQSGDIKTFTSSGNQYENIIVKQNMEKLPSIKTFFEKTKEFGVLYLNTSLSCGLKDTEIQKKYHSQQWKGFIKNVISDILKERDCIFVCFGADAKKFSQHIQYYTIQYRRQAKIIYCTHPSQPKCIEQQVQENVFQQIKNAEIDLCYETSIDFKNLVLIEI